MDTIKTRRRLLLWSVFIIAVLTGSAAQQVSPCPSVLQYLRDRTIVLTISPPYTPGSWIHLQIRMLTTSKQRVENDEDILLVEDTEILNERLLSGSQSPIKYKVSFTSRVPAIVKDIILNNRIICKNEDIDDGKYFEVNLAHFFQPEGKAVAVPSLRLDLGTECGKPDITASFIHRGDPTDPGQWPWHVGLYWQMGASQSYKCGGTLVTQTAVITAAHCVANARSEPMDPKMLTVYLGKHRLSLWGDEVQGKEIKSVHVHPSYNSSSHYNDIAVLKLRTPAYISIFVKPICVWGRNDEDLQDIIGKTGFG
ncbi:uncharacterized protein [Anabrus simplex]|uniref:uncharacterized protein isoform X2 n=1 Tax=Anabrus simplex TaxID=316456 RepID=UPI0034DCD479